MASMRSICQWPQGAVQSCKTKQQPESVNELCVILLRSSHPNVPEMVHGQPSNFKNFVKRQQTKAQESVGGLVDRAKSSHGV